MKRMNFGLAAAAVLAVLAGPAAAQQAEVKVYKSPWCGCCKGWIAHLQSNGFAVTSEDHENMDPIKAQLGVPERLHSCHTAVVNGYVIEGHVPADDIKRLLTEGPQAVGLSAPGMPAGSPGMETGGEKDAYQVILFGQDGMKVWAQH